MLFLNLGVDLDNITMILRQLSDLKKIGLLYNVYKGQNFSDCGINGD